MIQPNKNYIVAMIVTKNIDGEEIIYLKKEEYFTDKKDAFQYIENNSYIDYAIITEYRSAG